MRVVLSDCLAEQNITLPKEQIAFLEQHLNFVLKTNTSIRLTAITNRTEAERLHILDSLMALPEVLAAPSGPLLDLGSGGGYPGIPLALAGVRNTDLLDSVQKKIRALADFLAAHPLDSPVLAALALRAEELAVQRRAFYSIVTARAVASLPSLIELAAPLLSFGGQLIALKGKQDDDEIERGKHAALLVGMNYVSARSYTLPVGHEQRSILVFERTEESPRELPRRVGRAQKKPLA